MSRAKNLCTPSPIFNFPNNLKERCFSKNILLPRLASWRIPHPPVVSCAFRAVSETSWPGKATRILWDKSLRLWRIRMKQIRILVAGRRRERERDEFRAYWLGPEQIDAQPQFRWDRNCVRHSDCECCSFPQALRALAKVGGILRDQARHSCSLTSAARHLKRV